MQTTHIRIVILDRDLSDAFSMRQWLEGSGHRVIGIASSLAQARRIVSHEHADLALVETELEDGTDGAEAARILKQRHGLKILFVTAAPEAARQGADAAAGCVLKPIRPLALLAAIQCAVAQGASDQPGDRHVPVEQSRAFEMY